MYLPGTNCEQFKSAVADGYLCTCNTSNCNSITKGKEMIAKAQSGTIGDGVECHVCSGTGGLCTGENDGGLVVNCGDGVRTCLLAKSSKIYCNVLDSFDFQLKLWMKSKSILPLLSTRVLKAIYQ